MAMMTVIVILARVETVRLTRVQSQGKRMPATVRVTDLEKRYATD
ncbi:MAG: hypothetical protein OXL97_07340 [Chloroflexota bacterium]|nr:hypothetical protein [Chloroflexota bacterium]MDE2885912.1 hypothetical protein [Chloroflexota bacterium]